MTTTAPATETLPAVDAPYPGLTHFTEEYTKFFFGRDSECSVIIGNLCATRLTLLYAQSGVGKSSVLRAGVAARIRRQALQDYADGRPPRFVGAVFSTWTEDPVPGLVAAIAEAIGPFQHDPPDLSGLTLDDAVEAATNAIDSTLLIVLDQFEEYFLYHSDDAGDTFADQLARCINRPNLHVNVLISIREDAYAGLGDLFRGRLAHVYGNFLHLEYLDETGGREAIVKPIELLRASRPEADIDPALVDAVLAGVALRSGTDRANGHKAADAGPVQIETAYLQLVMRRLWDEETEAKSPVLRLETLERLGGTQEIIEGHLNRALRELSPPEQDAAAAAFRFLVTRAGTKIAWTTKDLAEVSDVPEQELGPILQRLASPKLKILRPASLQDGDEGASYEIFHDALARPIVRWRVDHALARERAAREEAQRQAAEAEEREGRERRRKTLALAGLAAAVVVLIAVGIAFAVIQSERANARLKADQSTQIADRVGSSALAPDAKGLAALEAMRLSPTFGARSAAVGVLQDNAALPLVLPGSKRAVFAVAFASDRSIVGGGADAKLRTWSSSGAQLKAFPIDNRIMSVAADPGGRYVVASADDGAVFAWPRSGKRVELLTSAKNRCVALPCTPVSVSPNGNLIAVGRNDGTVRVSNLVSRAWVSFEREQSPVRAIAFSSDGRRLAAAEDDGVVQWSVSPSGRLSGRESVHKPEPALAVAWAPDGRLAAAYGDFVEIWKPSGQALARFAAAATVRAVAFVDDGARVVYGGEDESISERDVATGEMVGAPRSHDGNVNAIAVSPDGKTIASASDDSYVKLWRADASQSLASIALGVPGMTNLGIATDGRVAAADRSYATLRIWTPPPAGSATAEPRVTKVGGEAGPLAVHGSVLAATNLSSRAHDSGFALWNIGSGCASMPRTPCRLGVSAASAAGGAAPFSIAFAHSGDVLAVGTIGKTGSVTLWNTSRPRHPRRLVQRAVPTGVNQFAFDPRDDSIFATASSNGSVRLWRYANGRLSALSQQRGADPVYAVAFSPDGKVLAAGGADQTVRLWNVSDPEHPTPVPSSILQSNSILSLAFSPDGHYLVAGDGDGGACLYDFRVLRFIGSNRCLIAPDGGSPNVVDAVAFSPSGNMLLTAGRGEPVVAWKSVLWGAGSDTALARDVCRLNGGRDLTAQQWSSAFADTELAGHRHATCS